LAAYSLLSFKFVERKYQAGAFIESATQGRKRSATATSLAEERAPPVNKRLVAVGGGGGEYLFPALQAAFNNFNLLMLLGNHDAEPRSRFIRTNRSASDGVSNSATSVCLVKAHTTCDVETGQVDTVWKDDAEILTGLIGKVTLASGATKEVYPVCISTPDLIYNWVYLSLIFDLSLALHQLSMWRRDSLR
jgi:hypothetical protein